MQIYPIRPRRIGSVENPLTFTSGLTRNGNTVTSDLITGKAGGQTAIGGTGAGENLTLQSTTNASRGVVVSADQFNITPAGSLAAPALFFGAAGNQVGFVAGANSLQLGLGGAGVLTVTKSAAPFVFTAPIPGSNNTASTEFVAFDHDMSRTSTWATGALATQREVLFRAPTYAFAAASTITSAATVAISAAPIAGANATITNPIALWVQAGTTRLDGGTISPTLTGGTAIAANLTLQSTTNAQRGAIVCNDALGVGRVPGTFGVPPQFAVAGNVSLASLAAATLGYVVVNAATVTVTGGTAITNARGFNYVELEGPNITATVSIGPGGTSPAAATLAIIGPPNINGGGTFAGAGAMALWVQLGDSFFNGQGTFLGNLNVTNLLVRSTTTVWTATQLQIDIGANTVTIVNAGGGLHVVGLITVDNGLSLTNPLVLNSDTAANGTGAAVTLPNFGGAGRPAAGTPAGWWHIKQSGNDRYVPFWGP